jgi:cytochrome c oxidase subunit IV
MVLATRKAQLVFHLHLRHVLRWQLCPALVLAVRAAVAVTSVLVSVLVSVLAIVLAIVLENYLGMGCFGRVRSLS